MPWGYHVSSYGCCCLWKEHSLVIHQQNCRISTVCVSVLLPCSQTVEVLLGFDVGDLFQLGFYALYWSVTLILQAYFIC